MKFALDTVLAAQQASRNLKLQLTLTMRNLDSYIKNNQREEATSSLSDLGCMLEFLSGNSQAPETFKEKYLKEIDLDLFSMISPFHSLKNDLIKIIPQAQEQYKKYLNFFHLSPANLDPSTQFYHKFFLHISMLPQLETTHI